jgi:hypothetical protein
VLYWNPPSLALILHPVALDTFLSDFLPPQLVSNKPVRAMQIGILNKLLFIVKTLVSIKIRAQDTTFFEYSMLVLVF